MSRFALLLILPAVSLAGCNVSKGSGGDNVSMSTDDNGQISMNLPFAKANVKLPASVLHKGEFDIDGVKLMPGSTMHGFNMDAGDKGATIHVGFDAPKSPDEVRAYFLDQFKQKGDEASQSGNTVSGKTKEGDTFVIAVEPSGQAATGTIAIQSKD